MNIISKISNRRPKSLNSVLALALDGGRLEGVVLRRVNTSLQPQQAFSVALTLDPLTAAPELAAREIRNHLDAAGIRERDCVFGVPLKWIFTAQTELPLLPDADAAGLLNLVAERGFHADAASLQIVSSRCPLPEGKSHVLMAAIPLSHLAQLEKVLALAKLKPCSFASALAAQQPPAGAKADGVLALAIGAGSVGLQITCGGGVVALRSLEGAVEETSGRPELHSDTVVREVRVTLGLLPAALREAVKRIRIFGPRDLAQRLADELELKFGPAGIEVETVILDTATEKGKTVSTAFCLGSEVLSDRKPAFEFLPPKPTMIEKFAAKYASGRYRTTALVAGGAAALIIGVFLFQQVQLWMLRSQWSKMQVKVTELEKIQDQIRQYRSWYGGSFTSLAVLRQLSAAFPEDGSVTAKNVDIRDGSKVICSGNALNNAALLKVEASLGAMSGITGVHREAWRGNKPPYQFVFSFKFNNGGTGEN